MHEQHPHDYHDHPHQPGYSHGHEHSQGSHVHTGHAVLDIGDDVGALIIYTPEKLLGREIEVSRQGTDGPRTHTEVLARNVSGNLVYAALFLALPAGDYTIWRSAAEPGDAVKIAGGEVAQVRWS